MLSLIIHRVYLALATEEDLRGLIIQQGGGKVSLIESYIVNLCEIEIGFFFSHICKIKTRFVNKDLH